MLNCLAYIIINLLFYANSHRLPNLSELQIYDIKYAWSDCEEALKMINYYIFEKKYDARKLIIKLYKKYKKMMKACKDCDKNLKEQ